MPKPSDAWGVATTMARVQKKSPAKAVEMYSKAADHGYVPAQYCLALSYLDGDGVEKAESKADESFSKSIAGLTELANSGMPEAQLYLGCCYYNGDVVGQSYAEAVKWYSKTAEQGIADARLNLGVCYYIGNGVVQSYSEAVRWFRKAAEQEKPMAQCDLGVCYEYGLGLEQSYPAAVKW